MEGLTLTIPVRNWACPSCNVQDRTQRSDAHTQMHNCKGLNGLSAPLVEVRDVDGKVDARHLVLDREDYAADADRIMAVRTDHGDGRNDQTVFPATARMYLNASPPGSGIGAHAPMAVAGSGAQHHKYIQRDPAAIARSAFASMAQARMAWSTSNMNAYYVYGMGTNLVKPSTDSFKVALFGNSVTPAQSGTEAVTEYSGAGATWSTGNEVSGTGYSAGGVAVSSPSWAQSSNVITFTSSGSPQWTGATITAYGDLVYDTTVANLSICWNYFGGVQTVTSGTFTISWSGSGICTVTC